MPRQLRIEYPGAIHHEMNRGDRREPIFRDDLDRKRFVTTIGEVCAKTDWQVHAYCLMLNHFHLVLETPHANLVAGIVGDEVTSLKPDSEIECAECGGARPSSRFDVRKSVRIRSPKPYARTHLGAV